MGGQVVRERYRLRPLEMRVARKHRVDLILGTADQGDGERADRGLELVVKVEDEQAQIQCDLVVPASPGVQLAGGAADPLGQDLLDRGVHILGPGRPREGAGGDLAR